MVGAAISGLVCGWVGSSTLPTRPFQAMEDHALRSNTLMIERLNAKEGDPTSRSDYEIRKDINTLQDSMKNIMGIYNQRKLEHQLTFFGIWVLSCLGLYFSILTTRWIIAGFRKAST